MQATAPDPPILPPEGAEEAAFPPDLATQGSARASALPVRVDARLWRWAGGRSVLTVFCLAGLAVALFLAERPLLGVATAFSHRIAC